MVSAIKVIIHIMITRKGLNQVLKRIGVTRINSISKYDDLPLYVYQACRPNSIHLTVDSGKGKTDDDAFKACAVEAIERYTAENIINKKTFVESSSQDLFVPNGKDFSTDASTIEIESYAGEELTCNKKVYVPTSYVDYKPPRGSLSSCAFTGTTGLGAHTTIRKAVCSGLVELIERDAIAKGRFEKLSLNKIDKSLSWLEKLLKERSARYAVLRYEANWPIEVVQIICDDPYVTGGMTAMGVGEDLMSAIEDAALEAMQTWLMRLAASRDDWAYSRVMDKSLFDQFINSSLTIKTKIPNSNSKTKQGKYSNELYESLINYACLNSQRVVVVPLKSNKRIPEITVVKVFLEHINLLRQGPMITGIPYMPSHP